MTDKTFSRRKAKKSFSYHLLPSSVFLEKNKKSGWKIFFENKEVSFLSVKKVLKSPPNIFNTKNIWKLPIRQLQISVASPNQIRSLCLRQRPEGFLIGRVWHARTVNYKDLRPIPGGLFCERAFGPLQRGICSCKRTWWRSYPKLPKKLRRFEIVICSYCYTQTIYSTFSQKLTRTAKFDSLSDLTNDQFPYKETFSIKIKSASSTTRLLSNFVQVASGETDNLLCNNTTCKCGKTKLYIHWFFSVSRSCRFCITSTSAPYYGKILTRWLFETKPVSSNTYKKTYSNKRKSIRFELVSSEYQPGFCECGRTSTEVPLDKSIFCGYCGTEISIEVLPRRYRLGYLPLSLPVTHFWYRYYEPRPLPRLTGFSRRLFQFLLRCERVVADEAFLTLKQQNQSYFSPEFRPVERLTNSNVNSPITRRNSINIRPENIRNHKKLVSQSITYNKEDISYFNVFNQYSVVFPEIKVFVFPWYCLYRDIPFFPTLKKERKENFGRNLEGLERLNKLLFAQPKQMDYFLNLYKMFGIKTKNQDFTKKVSIEEKLGIRHQVRWLSEKPARTGGELIFNRLTTLNQKDWCLQARIRLKAVKDKIEVFEKQGSLEKSERLRYRRLIRTRNQLLMRLRILIEMQIANLKIHWLILQCLPILPPDLRPILSLGEGKTIVADINTLYQRVIERNSRVAQRRRLARIYGHDSTRDLRYHERLLQESLECLFENSTKGKRREKDSKQRIYKSLAEVLKGKRGRFRNNLLGKRVDYSGRSVIVSGPDLDLYQCGLPRELVIVLFQPFLIRFLVGRTQDGQKIQTRFQARQFLEKQTSERWYRRNHVLRGLPVLLNRAPTLHRLGFQAFQPKLTYNRGIRIHPLVCSGFNADFDGDQIAVHVPLSPQSRSEAWRLMTSGSHFFSPAHGEPAFLPSQDIVLGTYYLTTRRNIFLYSRSFSSLPGFPLSMKSFPKTEKSTKILLFAQKEEVLQMFEKEKLKLHEFVWLYIKNSKVIVDSEHEMIMYERRLDKQRKEQTLSLWNWKMKEPSIQLFRTTVGRIIFSSFLEYLPSKNFLRHRLF